MSKNTLGKVILDIEGNFNTASLQKSVEQSAQSFDKLGRRLKENIDKNVKAPLNSSANEFGKNLEKSAKRLSIGLNSASNISMSGLIKAGGAVTAAIAGAAIVGKIYRAVTNDCSDIIKQLDTSRERLLNLQNIAGSYGATATEVRMFEGVAGDAGFTPQLAHNMLQLFQLAKTDANNKDVLGEFNSGNDIMDLMQFLDSIKKLPKGTQEKIIRNIFPGKKYADFKRILSLTDLKSKVADYNKLLAYTYLRDKEEYSDCKNPEEVFAKYNKNHGGGIKDILKEMNEKTKSAADLQIEYGTLQDYQEDVRCMLQSSIPKKENEDYIRLRNSNYNTRLAQFGPLLLNMQTFLNGIDKKYAAKAVDLLASIQSDLPPLTQHRLENLVKDFKSSNLSAEDKELIEGYQYVNKVTSNLKNTNFKEFNWQKYNKGLSVIESLNKVENANIKKYLEKEFKDFNQLEESNKSNSTQKEVNNLKMFSTGNAYVPSNNISGQKNEQQIIINNYMQQINSGTVAQTNQLKRVGK